MKIALVNMPFASVTMPSLALTQLASVLKTRFGGRVEIATYYYNLEFFRYFGAELYGHLSGPRGFMAATGDWLFRQIAFPETRDNAVAYLGRFYFEDDDETAALRDGLLAARRGLPDALGEMIRRDRLAEADVVGFTTLFSQTVASIAAARLVREENPASVIVMGGCACEGTMGQAYADNVACLDAVFSGPGLVSFPEFIGARIEGGSGRGIRGVLTRGGGADRCRAVPDEENEGCLEILGQDLSIETCVPLDYTAYLDAFERTFPDGDARCALLFETSRGCYWAERMVCSFCGLNGLLRKYRSMSPAAARACLHALSAWRDRCGAFIAVDTVMPRNYLTDLFPDLGLPDGMRLMYEVRPDLKDDELRVLCEAGVRSVQPGIEALSSDSLRRMRKGTTAFSNIRFLKACSRWPVSLDWNLLIGMPGEPDETLKKYLRDIPLLTHLAPPTGAYPINYVRNSLYFDHASEYGLDLHPQDFYALIYPFEKHALSRMANHFVDRNADMDRLDAWLDRLNEIVRMWRSRWTGSDGKEQARLCFFEDTEQTVYDTRDGSIREHTLNNVCVRLMRAFERPLTIDAAAGEAGVPVTEAEDALGRLHERGLLFEEDGRCISLVTR